MGRKNESSIRRVAHREAYEEVLEEVRWLKQQSYSRYIVASPSIKAEIDTLTKLENKILGMIYGVE